MKSVLIPAVLAASLFTVNAHAHDVWIAPSSTVLSGAEATVTFDAGSGNDLFYYNHRPMSTDGLHITNPKGEVVQAHNIHRGDLRSNFDLRLTDDGTYRVAILSDGVFARWKENGDNKRWMGKPEDLADKVPQNAEDLLVIERQGRVETFVTKGGPTDIQPVGKGMELVLDTHPNDLFTDETTQFTVLLNGKPAAGLDVEIAPDGGRYRDDSGKLTLTTNEQGRFSIKWPQAGLFWVHTDISDEQTTLPAAKRRNVSYVGTFEVLPQ